MLGLLQTLLLAVGALTASGASSRAFAPRPTRVGLTPRF